MRIGARPFCAIVAVFMSCTLVSCKGELVETGVDAPSSSEQPPVDEAVEINTEVSGVGTIGIRRLSQREFDDTLTFLLGDTSLPSTSLPEDNVDPFDNDWEAQRISQTLVEALESIATSVSTSAMSDPERRAQIVGCEPADANDDACFREFIVEFGRKALRRPLTSDEIESLAELQEYSVETDDFYVGARLVLQTLLQMPDFVYHVHRGVPVEGREGVYRLTQFEVASRLSFFLWGTPPDDELLDAAASDQLVTEAHIRAQAERLIADPRARQRIYRFHALWMGYHRFSANDSLGAAMQAETERLIDRVVFEEKRNYFDLFTFDQTFINDELATHYGFDGPGSEQGTWVDYPEGVDRGGVFSHATFLGVAARFGDTSPTQRGRVIRERLMCQQIDPPPPELEVDVDAPPPSNSPEDCKQDRYEAILAQDGCAVCHVQMDPIGFGLENYDQFGRFREHDSDAPGCEIPGVGELAGVGEFRGPRELGSVLAESGRLEMCLVQRLYQFATAARPGRVERPVLDSLQQGFEESDYRFDQLLIEVASSEAFRYRQTPSVGDGQ